MTTYTAHFHGGVRDGQSRDGVEPLPETYLDLEEEPDGDMPGPVLPGQPYPTLPNSRYVLRSGDISDGLHYDWQDS